MERSEIQDLISMEMMNRPPMDKKTPTVMELASKHSVSIKKILEQALKGIDVEMEHSSDPTVAFEIACDHLNEIPDYYDRLEEMEKVKAGEPIPPKPEEEEEETSSEEEEGGSLKDKLEEFIDKES